jgi:cytochrome c2
MHYLMPLANNIRESFRAGAGREWLIEQVEHWLRRFKAGPYLNDPSWKHGIHMKRRPFEVIGPIKFIRRALDSVQIPTTNQRLTKDDKKGPLRFMWSPRSLPLPLHHLDKMSLEEKAVAIVAIHDALKDVVKMFLDRDKKYGNHNRDQYPQDTIPFQCTKQVVENHLKKVEEGEEGEWDTQILDEVLCDVKAAMPRTKAKGSGAEEDRIQWLAKAMLLVKDHPGWPDAKIAKKVGKAPSTLCRNTTYKVAAANARGDKGDRPSGYITANSKTGQLDVEATAPEGDQSDCGLPIEGSKYFREYCDVCHEPMKVAPDKVGKNPLCEDCQ